MNWKLLLQDLTVKQFEDLSENWYSRLNNLKEYYYNNPDNVKAKPLISEMQKRMMIVARLYREIRMLKYTPKPKESGIIISYSPETITDKRGFQIILP